MSDIVQSPQSKNNNLNQNSNQIMVIITHLSSFFCPIIFSLVVFLISDDNPTLKNPARQSLGFQLTMTIWYIIAGLILLIGIPLFPLLIIGFLMVSALAVINFVMPIVACVQSSENSNYKYPKIFNFILP